VSPFQIALLIEVGVIALASLVGMVKSL